ncbi:MAG: hypothetical protein JO102_04300, partial [Elusimicrobia bacterium]|nr:hypothetical protein [Elusimicrobiota bacterium]
RDGLLPGGALGRAALHGRAPASPASYVRSAAPASTVEEVTMERAGPQEERVDLSRVNGTVAVDVHEAADGELDRIDETPVPTGTYALGKKLFGRFATWKRATEIALAWIVEFPSLIKASFSRAAFEAYLKTHWDRLAERRAALERLTFAIRATLLVAAAGAFGIVLSHGSFELRLVVVAVEAAVAAGAAAASTAALAGHLAQNILGIPLTNGHPGDDAARWIVGGRVYHANEPGVPLRTRLELDGRALGDRTDDLGRRILDIVARRQFVNVQVQGRSLVLTLAPEDAIHVGEEVFTQVVMKKTTYQGNLPSTAVYVPGPNDAMVQPTHALTTTPDGQMVPVPIRPRPTGSGRLRESISEYREMRAAHLAGVPTPLPVGIGEFPDLKMEGEDESLGFLVYLDNPGQRISQALTVRGRTYSSFRAAGGSADAFLRGFVNELLAPQARAAGAALRRLHDAGLIHQAPHLDQFATADANGNSRIYDFDGAMSAEGMTRQEFIFWCMEDLFYLYSAIDNGLSRGDTDQDRRLLYTIRMPMIGANDPFEAMLEGYFRPGERDAMFPYHFRMDFPMLHRRVTIQGNDINTIDPEFVAYFERVGGPVHDEILRAALRRQFPGTEITDAQVHLLGQVEREFLLHGRTAAQAVVPPTIEDPFVGSAYATVAGELAAHRNTERTPILLLPFTRWLATLVYRFFHPFDGFLRQAVQPIRPVVLRPSEPVDDGVIVGMAVAEIRSAFHDWSTSPGVTHSHQEGARVLEAGLRRIPITTGTTALLGVIAQKSIEKLADDDPLDVMETLDIVGVVIDRLPATPEGDQVRETLFKSLVSALQYGDDLGRSRVLDLLRRLSPRVSADAADAGFPAALLFLSARDHGVSIRAGKLVDALLPRVSSIERALEALADARVEVARRRSIPDPSGETRALFQRLTDLADAGALPTFRSMWMRQTRLAVRDWLDRRSTRIFAVPAIELPGLPGLAFAFWPLAGLIYPSASLWVAAAAAGLLFAALHGRQSPGA